MPSISDFIFHPVVMERTPFYPFSTYNMPLDRVVRDPCFINALFLSSKSLYEALERKDFLYDHLSEKERLSIRQYFNRMCYRPTPFGLFAGISVATWNKENRKTSYSAGYKVKSMLNYEHGMLISEQIIKRQTDCSQIYILNPSLYRVNNEYRYIKYIWDNDGKRTFFIESLESSDVVKNILSYFQKDHHLKDLVRFIMKEYGITVRKSREFSSELIRRQVILPELLPNITGRDYLERVVKTLGDGDFQVSDKSVLQDLFSPDVRPLNDFIHNITKISNEIHEYSGFKACNKAPLYVNLEREDQADTISYELREKITEALYCLEKMVPGYQSDTLIKFRNDFKTKFDLRWIPLMVALDPEVGVGYCNLGKEAGQCDLIENVAAKCQEDESDTIQWSCFQKFILDKWNLSLKNEDHIPIIRITEKDLDLLKRQTNTIQLPPGIAVLFRTVGDEVYIEEAGGASAVSVIGRFTAFNESVKKAAEQLTEAEQAANPEVVFAEIAHLNDLKSANIDRRASLRKYEIPVATGSDVDRQYRIALNDLWVSVVDDEIIIWSKRLQKRIIPRLSSAFNFLKNDLPAFRFLCDLQFQGIRTNFKLGLSELIPGLSFYPRVVYQSAILHLASWHINKEVVNTILAFREAPDRLKALKKMVTEMHWPRRISVNRQDNYIVIDTARKEELFLLLELLKKNQSLVIREFPFADSNKQHTGNYISQHIALLYQTQAIYHQVSPPLKPVYQTQKVQRNFLPGSNWNYFKIYCHPARSNAILTQCILPLCERWLNSGFIKKWFFVRYTDPHYHLRIRINNDPVNTGLLIKGFNHTMTSLTDTGVVNDFKVNVYNREIERYGEDIIEYLEKAFFASTRLIISFINQSSEYSKENNQLKLAYSSINILLDCFKCSLEDKIHLFEQFYIGMKSEFAISVKENERLKKKFRAIGEAGTFLPINQIVKKLKLNAEVEYFRFTLNEIYRMVRDASPERRAGLLGDIIHMHLNRLFVTSHRKNELVLYYCLWRHYVSEAGRQRSIASGMFADQHCVDESK